MTDPKGPIVNSPRLHRGLFTIGPFRTFAVTILNLMTLSFSLKAYFIFNPGIKGGVSTSSKSLTIDKVPCLYFWKWDVWICFL